MTYADKRRAPRGLMGLGVTVADDQDPVDAGQMAKASPVLGTASVIASNIMLSMASVPRSKRMAKMVEVLNRGQPGLGASARADFLRRSAAMGPRKKDQAMFDAIRAALADSLTEKLLRQSPFGIAHLTGLGQTVAEASGRTSQAVNDANALFCSYGAGIGAMVGGFAAQFGSDASAGSTAGIAGSRNAAQIAGCGAGQLVIQAQVATAQAQAAQSNATQAIAMQQAEDARFMRMALVGAGLLGALGIGYMVVKKS